MGCDCQTTATPFAADPCRRVNYTLGMILGVDDFVQESVYHSSHREALARLAIGYGTLTGLDVKLEPSEEPGSTDTQARVTKGSAIAPSGRIVNVDVEQCCSVSDWARLDKNRKLVLENPDGTQTVLPALETRPGSPGSWARAWVTLAFSEAKLAEIPLPGDPCRTDDKLTAPSRVEDGFHLDISWRRPDQLEEDALRRYFEWVCRIPVEPDGTDLTESVLLDAIRAEAKKGLPTTGAPTSVPDAWFQGIPDASLHYKGELLRAVMRLWITEIRPLWFACCPGDDPAGWDTLLLTGLWLPVAKVGSSDWTFDASRPVELEQTHRPTLLSLRALQEMVRRLEDQFYSIIPKPAATVETETVFGLLPDQGTATEYARADHTHGTPALPALAKDLTGSLGDGGGTAEVEVVGLRGVALDAGLPTTNGQILTFDGVKWAPSAPAALAGDAVGAPGANQVQKLRGVPLSATAPANGQILSFDGISWSPSTPPSPPTSFPAGGDLSGTTAAATVVKLQGTDVSGTAPTNGQVLAFDGSTWTPQDPAAGAAPGGDLGGSLAAAKVQGIQGVPVAATAPTNGQILSFDGAAWKPVAPPSGGGGAVVAAGDVAGPIGTNAIAKLQGATVKTVAPKEGEALVFSGGMWQNKAVAGGVGDAVARMATPYQLVGAGQVVVNLNADGIAVDFKAVLLYHCKAKLDDPLDAAFRLLVQCEAAADKALRFVQLTPVWSKEGVPVLLSLEPNGATDIVRGEIDRFRTQQLKGPTAFQFQIFQTPIPAV